MRAKQSLGQNFLMHAATAERIVAASGVGERDTVLEIGPGTGLLTRALLQKARRVIAVEADQDLIPVLQAAFAPELTSGRLELIAGDVRTFDPASIGEPYHLVANIPYYITGELFRQFLTATHKPRSLTFLIQKEVAIRIARSKKESLLSLAIKAYGTPRYQFTVPRGAFRPAPKVDSAVLSVQDVHDDAFPDHEAEEWFFKVLRAGFAHKRKLLMKNLEEVASRTALLAAFARAQIKEKARAEDLSIETWRLLAQMLKN
ncbi:MAG TPA: 16S rRNA (adenine(1518)-N(6)/adenine(1519)-N(6))-dimethyltransferase RsmA [Candidatus Paceibacterota bacterium]|nr:16S rRNA (adenine(1518)-N(6)/adenine(1519)-N(6))-dimethyltransferase RsmA [Candidatus Paceibacterota bacterium]